MRLRQVQPHRRLGEVLRLADGDKYRKRGSSIASRDCAGKRESSKANLRG